MQHRLRSPALRVTLAAASLAACGAEHDTFELSSNLVGDTFRLQAWAPPDLSPGAPLVVLLDGDFWFNRVAPIHAQVDGASSAVLVGVGYANGNARERDLLPPEEGGDVATFFQFIEDELLPELVARYGVTQARDGRCLCGHSNGGFAALWSALARPELFAGVVAASPNLATADGMIFNLLDASAADAAPTTLRTAVGSLETPASITAPHALLTQRLAEETTVNLRHEARVFGGLSHSRVVGPAYRWAIADCVGGTP